MWEYDVELLAVGDTFEGGAILQNYFIMAVLAAGGKIAIDGNEVTILELPKKEVPKAPVYEFKLEEAAKLISEYNATVTDGDKLAAPVLPVPLVADPKLLVDLIPASKPVGRPRKILV